ncbi:MAG: hypothetical protein ACW99F_14085 [Candidatus Hodarchaeales archaeon]|jgi:hypothetical protein
MANGDDGGIAKGAIDAVAKSAEILTDTMDVLRGTAEALAEPFDKAAKASESFMQSLGASGGFVGFKDLALQLDNLQVSLQQATGQGDKFLKMSMGVSGELGNLSITTNEASQAAQSLFSSFRSFTLLAPQSQRALVKQASAMTRLGISTQTTAQNQEILIKAMGMTSQQAIATNEDLAAFALDIGEAPAKIANDFAAVGPKLAKYGKSGTKVFKQLAAQSKATGVEMGKLLAMTEKFDTFEGAAQSAGQLNAMLGGPLLNSVQLLTATESERVDLIRNAVNATGRSFESMNRFEKQAIAQAAGIGDVADAVRLFGTEQAALDDLEDKVDPSIKAQQDLTKAMNKGVSIANMFTAAFEKLSEIVSTELKPVFRDIAEFMTGKEGLGSARSIFKEFAGGLRKVLGFLKKFKGPAKDITGMVIKVGALGFAFKQGQSLISPVMDLLTNPWALIFTGIMLVYKNWDKLVKIFKSGGEGVGDMFSSLDDKIMGFFAEYEDPNGGLIYGLKTSYMWLKKNLPEGIKYLKGVYDQYIQPIVDGISQDIEKQGLGNYLRGILDKTVDTISSAIDSFKSFVNGIWTGLQKFYRQMVDYAQKGSAMVLTIAKGLNLIGQLDDKDLEDIEIFNKRMKLKEEAFKREGYSSVFNANPAQSQMPEPPITQTERQAAMMSMPDQNMSVPIVIQSTIELDGEAVGTASQEVISSRMGNGDLMNSALPTNSAKLR